MSDPGEPASSGGAEKAEYTSHLEALHTHAAALAGAESIQDIGRITLLTIEKVLGFSEGAFGVVEGEKLNFVYTHNIDSAWNREMPLDGKGITIRAVRTGRVQLVTDTRLDPDFVRDLVNEPELLSELDVPVIIGGRAVAVINLQTAQAGAYDAQHLKLVELFSWHVASAIQRLQQVEEAKRSEDNFRNILEAANEPVFVIVGTQIVYANTRTAKFLGVKDPSTLIGIDVLTFIVPEQAKLIEENTFKRQRGEYVPSRYNTKLRRTDGSVVDTEISAYLTRFRGQTATVVFYREITERLRYEARLLALVEHASKLAQARTIPEVAEATIRTAKEVLGYSLFDFMLVEGDHLQILQVETPEDSTIPLSGKGVTVRAYWERRMVVVDDVEREPGFIHWFKDARSEVAVPVIVDGVVVAVLNAESASIAAFTKEDAVLLEILALHVASAISVIKQKQLAEGQQDARTRELLDAASRVSNMVRHDLRGPLQTIKNATYLAYRHPDKVQEMLELVARSVDYATRILEDLKNTTTPATLVKFGVDMTDLLNQSLKSAYLPDNVKVEATLQDGLSAPADSVRMRRVFDNLIKNAVDAMPFGGTLGVKAWREGDSLRVDFWDTGTGMSEETISNLFKPFYTTKKTGTGLGLVYCRETVTAHGGTITVDSRLNEGTRFMLQIPVAKQASPVRKPGSPP